MIRFLITGGSGFIGTALSRRLLAQGHQVTILDPQIPPDWHEDRPSLRWVRARLNPNDMEYHAAEADHVVHLASLVGVKHYLSDPVTTAQTITEGASTVGRICLEVGVPLLALSSSEAYGSGNPSGLPLREDHPSHFGPSGIFRWAYGTAKYLADQILLGYAAQGLQVRIVRPFNVVGPGQAWEGGLVFPAFANQVVQGGPLQVHGDGMQTRTFVWVEDFVDGLLATMETPSALGLVMNLGNDNETAILELAHLFRDAAWMLHSTSVDVALVPYHTVYPSGFQDTPRRCPDLTRAKSLIGWDTTALEPLRALVDRSVLTAGLPHAPAEAAPHP